MKNNSVNQEEILLVDDEVVNLACFNEFLSAVGYHVRTATNGTFALKSIQKSPPDLVVLDVKIPGLNGYQLYHALQLDEQTRHIPVIFMSGVDRTFDQNREDSDINDCDYLLKPVDLPDLLTHIQQALKKSREATIVETLHATSLHQ